MTKTILFPTDFSLESLNLVKQALLDYKNEELDILLVHGIHLSDSITELLYFSKSKIIKELTNNEFEDACETLRNRSKSNVHSFRIELFIGFTQAAFDNYIDAYKVQAIYIPLHYTFRPTNRMSTDILGYARKAKVPIIEVLWPSYRNNTDSDPIANISPA